MFLKTFLCLLILLLGCTATKDNTVVALHDALIVSSDINFIASTTKAAISSHDRKRLCRFYPKTLEKLDTRKQLSVQDVQNMTRSGLDDGTIIKQIDLTNSRFFLDQKDEMELTQAGVSKKVICHMKDTVNSVTLK